jgi:hypothetical protein
VWRRRLLAWEEESVRECSVLVHNVVLQDNVSDTWRWMLDPVHGYSVREAYRFITSSGVQVDRSLVDDVWHKLIPSKVSLFVWRLLRNRIPTKDNLLRRRVLHSNETTCVSGCGNTETVSHLFLGCPIFGSLWYHVWQWLGISSVSSVDIRQHFNQFTGLPGMPRNTRLYLKVIWFATVWAIWKERNNRLFQTTVSDPSVLADKVKLNSFLWLKSNKANFSFSYHNWWKHPVLCMGVHM